MTKNSRHCALLLNGCVPVALLVLVTGLAACLRLLVLGMCSRALGAILTGAGGRVRAAGRLGRLTGLGAGGTPLQVVPLLLFALLVLERAETVMLLGSSASPRVLPGRVPLVLLIVLVLVLMSVVPVPVIASSGCARAGVAERGAVAGSALLWIRRSRPR